MPPPPPARRLQAAFTEHLNNCLGGDEFLKGRGYLPMAAAGEGRRGRWVAAVSWRTSTPPPPWPVAGDDLFRAIADGILLR
jgi:hypothetical protein